MIPRQQSNARRSRSQSPVRNEDRRDANYRRQRDGSKPEPGRQENSPTAIGTRREYCDDDDKNEMWSTENGGVNILAKNESEDRYWRSRREERERLGTIGVRRIWGYSPTHQELESVFEDHRLAEKMVVEEWKHGTVSGMKEGKKKKRKRKSSTSSSDQSAITSSSDDGRSKKKSKRKNKDTKDQKRRSNKKGKKGRSSKRKRHSSSSSSNSSDSDVKESDGPEGEQIMDEEGEVWVEVTKEMKAEQSKKEEAALIGPQIPEHIQQKLNPASAATNDIKLDAAARTNMLRGEAAAMAAYAAQGKRIPRRGEIGLTSDEIATYEQAGYVMSGTRHKAMEATRLRKENQILTAEEKRMLKTFSQDERTKREDTVLGQFRNLISSKKSKG